MNPSLPSRSGLLALIMLFHGALLWALAMGLNQPPLSAPLPLPAVMVEMLAPARETVRPEPARPAPAPSVEPVKRETPKPTPKKAEARPLPVEKSPVPAPAAPVPAPAPAAAAQPAPATPAAAPSAPANPAPSAAAPAPAPLAPPSYKAAYLNNPLPVYPAMLRRAGEEGRVVLKVLVTAEGTAGDVQLARPSSHPQFDEAALAAVRKWRFQPARRGETPVAVWYDVPIDFKLVN